MPDPVIAYIALGSNLGDRRAYLDQAVALLRQQAGISELRISTYHPTEPVGGPAGQGKYLNAAASLRTTLTPPEFLRVLQGIEQQLGRVRAERDGPRTLDLDLLLFGTEIIQTDELVVPHPRLAERLFVLAPLVEIAPLAVHPVARSTAQDLLDRLLAATDVGASRRELSGMRAVVTGSTSGIGQAIAEACARSGADVVIHGRRSRAAADAVAQRCAEQQVRADVLLADVSDERACGELVEQAWDTGPIDLWVNCAGADTLTGDAAAWSFERKLAELWAVDVRGTMLLARAIGARMKKRGRGVILNVGWDQAETGMEGDSGQLFGATKGAVMAFTKGLALSLAPEVRVNCLAPGWIRTAWGEQASALWQARVLRETPLARWGTPADIARAAVWLASPAAEFITGQIIRVNGGVV